MTPIINVIACRQNKVVVNDLFNILRGDFEACLISRVEDKVISTEYDIYLEFTQILNF